MPLPAPPRIAAAPPFASYWQAGYEGADHNNHAGQPLDMNVATGHLDRVRADYALLQQFGICTVRESAGWRLCERDGRYDFRILDSRLQAAQDLGLQICWTFCHYGWPDDLDIFGDAFVPRFVRFCSALAQYLAPWTGAQPVYSPINEISFQSWGLSLRMFHCKHMHHPHAGEEGKRQLVRASIAGCEAIWQITPGARILQCDPLIHVIAPPGRPDWAPQAAGWRAAQFDAWDMLCGRRAPELGGAERYLDLMGCNYYHSNQWESGTNLRLWWHLDDPRRLPLHHSLLEMQQRYSRPLLLTETSHVGSGRGAWIRQIAEQAALAVQHGVDLRGICVYPAIDRPDWEQPEHWHKSGVWEVDLHSTPPLARVPVPPYVTALHQAIRLTNHLCPAPGVLPVLLVFCHHRWDGVCRRPQQLLSRLALYYRVLFIEPPQHDASDAHWDRLTPVPNLTVYRPRSAAQADQQATLQALLARLPEYASPALAWLCTPMALPLLPPGAGAVVYDCMAGPTDQDAVRLWVEHETALLRRADLVLAPGPGLYELMRRRHANVHRLDNSVDAVHFEQARDRSNGHPLHADLPHPRLGFYGAIDSRIDTGLLADLADAHPQWQVLLVGPVLGIDPAALPQRQNLHYLGQQAYQALPHFLAGWDVCLLPYKLHGAPRLHNPIQLLEYMAAGLPIVSTALPDVAQVAGTAVAIGRGHAQFIAHCEAALALDAGQRAALAQRMRAVVQRTSWDGAAARVHSLMEQTRPIIKPTGETACKPTSS